MSPGTQRHQSLGEEIANSASHAIGLVASVVAVPFLLVMALRHGSTWTLVGVSVFAATTILLYLASTIYHAMPHNRAKRVLQVIDHAAIFLLIAGTYTPFTLGVLRGAWGWTLFGLVWGVAIIGVMLKAMRGVGHPRLSTSLYLGMGWLALIAARPLALQVPVPGLLWLLAGGLCYTIGVAFFATDRVRYNHFVWHLFVLAGTTCHFFAVLWYSA